MENLNDTEGIMRVDLKQVFMEKNPRIAKLFPGFVYWYLKRIIHQDYINYFLSKHGHKHDLDFIQAVIDEFNIDLIIKGTDNLKNSGKYIFASNHPLGGFDGMMLLNVVSKYYGEVKFLVNDILMNIKNLEGLFIPINKHGSQSRESVLLIDKVFRSGNQILTFPSGYVSRKIKGIIQDLTWQKHFISKAIQYQRDVIPVHISGRNTNFFYNLANIRKFLGIKWNLEMFYLVDETYKHRNKTITMIFGPRIQYTEFDKTHTHMQWAQRVREIVYSLPTGKVLSLRSKK